MAKLWGKEYRRSELLRLCGRLDQIAGFSRYEMTEGFAKGVEIIEVRTGSGFEFGVCPSRGLDIVWARHNGKSLSWQSKTGIVHPAFYNEANLGWLRGFAGGLLTTCGLHSFGPACEDEGETFGLHDRISYTPAENVHSKTEWIGDSMCNLSIEGTLRQTRVFGANLRLEREIRTQLGRSHVFVNDKITNDGFAPAPLTLLYHCNFGFPFIAPGSMIRLPSMEARPRDEAAQKGADNWQTMEEPNAEYAEQCFFHEMAATHEGYVKAEIWNPEFNLSAYLQYKKAQFPFFTQWKMMGAGDYVCGLEPSNAPLASRAELRRRGELPFLDVGETREFEVVLGVSSSA